MKPLLHLLLVLLIAAMTMPAPASAAANDPLFVNLTTDDGHRAKMGIVFGKNQFERGHPLTIFLNDRGVLLGSTAHAAKFGEHQKLLAEAIARGATVLICPMCMKHFEIKEAELLPGIKVGNPEVTGGALFATGTRALTW